MKVLITGAAGFIGSHLAERLLARGDEVVALDNFDPFYDRAVKEENLAAVEHRAELFEGDIRDARLLDEILGAGGFEVVAHLAALAGVRPSIAEPARYQDVNVAGTAQLAEAMRRHGVRRMVFASSSSVYGDNEEVPYTEAQRVDDPASPYAASKRAGELLLRTFHKLQGMSVSCLRYFTVYGPRQRPEMAIHKFARLIERGEPVPMFGDGSSSRDYTYVDDAVDGTVGAIDRAPEGFSIYNLGNTHPVRLDTLIAKIGEALALPPRIEERPFQPGDVQHTWAAIEAAARDLGYQPRVPIEEGLRRFVTWMRAR
jgi:UDP-glucuronate 4-epimerase